MKKCECSLRGKLLGDGFSVCNPAQALEYALERIEELEKERKTIFFDGWKYGWENSAEGYNFEYGCHSTGKQMDADLEHWEAK